MNGVGVALHVRGDIPCKKFKMCKILNDINSIFVVPSLIKTKWILCGC